MNGSLRSGVTLEDLVIKGASPDNRTDLRAEEVAIDYSWPKLIREGVVSVCESIAIRQLQGAFDFPALPEKPPTVTETREPKPFPWNRLPQPDLAVTVPKLTVYLDETDRKIDIQGLDLQLSKQSSAPGHLQVRRLELPNVEAVEDVELTLAYTETGVRLTEWQALPHVQVNEFSVSVQERGIAEEAVLPEAEREHVLQFEANVEGYEGVLQMTARLDQAIRLELRSGALDLEAFGEGMLPGRTLSGKLTTLTATIDEMAGPPASWTASARLEGRELGFEQWTISEMEVDANLAGGELRGDLSAQLDAQNAVDAEVSAVLPDGNGGHSWEASGTVTVEAPELQSWLDRAERNLPFRLEALRGALTFRYGDDALQALTGSLVAEQFRNEDWRIPEAVISGVPVSEEAPESSNRVRVRLAVPDGEESGLQADVTVDVATLAYEGEFTLALRNLADWQVPHPEREGWYPWEGALTATWTGKGNVEAGQHAGQADLGMRDVAPANRPLGHDGDLEFSYENDRVEISRLEWRKDDFAFAASGRYAPEGIVLPEIQLKRGEETWLQGRVDVPLAPRGSPADRLWKSDRPIDVSVHSVEIPVEELAKAFSPETKDLGGTIKLEMTAHGLAEQLEADLIVTGRDFRGPVPKDLPLSTDFDLRVSVRDGRLTVDGQVKEKNLNPLEVTGVMPFSWRALNDIGSAPIEAKIRCEQTSLELVPLYVPAVTDISGTMSVDVHVAGTLREPRVSGSADIKAPRVKLKSNEVPELRNIDIAVSGNGERVTIEKCAAMIAGGTLQLDGRVSLGGERREADLRLRMEQAPFLRSSHAIIRANADLRLRGPIQAAALTGNLGLVESRLFREIEILPTEMPTRSVPTAARYIEKSYGIDAEPFRDWNIDIRVRTAESFRVRTNLAAMNIAADLQLTGKGNQIWPIGRVWIDDGYAQLPFSQLDFGPSSIHFDRASGFQGRLDISAKSLIRDYEVRVNVGGNLNRLDLILSSSPPLPEEDIMTLLATGTTREALLGDENVVASRAAMLVFDKLWRKLSKKDWSDPDEMRRRRLTFEPTQIDPKSGQTATSARLRLTDRWSISADADIQGDVRGLLHFLFRF